jgi:hypothetical protein
VGEFPRDDSIFLLRVAEGGERFFEQKDARLKSLCENADFEIDL